MPAIVRTFAPEVKHLFHPMFVERGLTANVRSRTFVPERKFPNTCALPAAASSAVPPSRRMR